MNIERSQDKAPLAHEAAAQRAAGTVSAVRLRRSVEALAFPRHFTREPEANKKARDWIAGELRHLGYTVEFQGKFGDYSPCVNTGASTGLTDTV